MRIWIANLLALGVWLSTMGGTATAEVEKKADAPMNIEPAAVNLDRPVDFEADLYPILESKCIACHNIAIDEGGFNLEEVDEILKGGGRGPAVVAKDPDKSLLFQVAARGKEPLMPPLPNDVGAEAFTPEELGLLRQWILEGATAGAGGSAAAMQWQPLPSGLNAIYSVALSPWGRFVAAGRANQITVYDIVTGEETARLADPHLSALEHEGGPMYPGGAAHRDFVHALAFSPDGTLLASGGFRAVKLWQRPPNARKAQFGSDEAVTAVAVSPDGKWAAVGSADHSVKLWNLEEDEPAGTFSGHEAEVTGLQFSPDGTKLFSGSLDQSVRVWNVPDGAEAGHIKTPAAVQALTLNNDATKVISGHADHLIRVWDPSAEPETDAPEDGEPEDGEPAEGEPVHQPVQEIQGHGQAVTSLALIQPEGTQIVSGSEDGTVRIWTLENGNQVRSMNHGGPVTAVAARPDGELVASAGANNVAKLWQVANGQQRAELKGNLPSARTVAALTEEQTVAAQLVAHAASAVETAEERVKEREEALETAKKEKEEADKALSEAKDKDDEDDDALKEAQEAQESAERAVELAETAVERTKERLEQATAEKEAADERKTQIDAELEMAQQADAETAKPLQAIAFSPDGKKLATAGDDPLIHVWDAENGVPLETLAGHDSPVAALAFGGDGVLLSGAADKSAIAWDVNPPWQLVGQLGPPADAPLDLDASPFISRVSALDFSPDGKFLATGGGDPSRSGELMIWDVEDLENLSLVREIEDAHSDTVFGVEFSRDGQFLLSGGADKFVKIFEVADGSHVRSFEGHTHHVLDVSWKADGTIVASAGADNDIKVWNVESGEQQRTISNYSKQVTSIQFMGVDERIISSGGDRTVRLHRTANGQNVRTFGGGTDFMYAATATRDEAVVIAGGEDGVLRVWNGENGQSLMTFEPPPPAEGDDAQASASGEGE